MRKPEIIVQGGKEIVYLDFTGMRNPEEIIQFELDGSKLIRAYGANKCLTLTNMEDMYFNNHIREKVGEIVKGNGPFVKASAVVGLKGLISIMYSGFISLTGRNIKLFKTKDEAINYLISVE